MTTQTTVLDDQFVAFRVRYELRKQERSVRDLARELDMAPSSMHRRVTAETPFSATEIGRVAEVLDVPVDVFFPPRSIALAEEQPDHDARDGAQDSEDPNGPRGRRKQHGRSVRRSRGGRGPMSGNGRRRAS